MLCLHIPSLLPPPFVEMDVSAVAQTAAMAGVGLLYRGTAHRLMVEFLLAEVSAFVATRRQNGYIRPSQISKPL